MFYSIRHVTRFRYSAPVRESVMELRMQPRSEGPQTLRSFQISTNPRAQLYAYTDHMGNAVYHFNLLREHEELRIEAQATGGNRAICRPGPTSSMPWNGAATTTSISPTTISTCWSRRDSPGPRRSLHSFMKIADLEKPVGDPLTALSTLQRGIYDSFDYESGITEVNSPIERGAGGAPRRLPGLRPHHDRHRARPGASPPAMSRAISITRAPRPFRRRRHPCLGGSLSAVAGLGGL